MKIVSRAQSLMLVLAVSVVVTGCVPSSTIAGPSVETPELILASDGRVLGDDQAAEFLENSKPLDPDRVEFVENEDLSRLEASQRAEELAFEYQVGEPLSESDLEFVRAYLIPIANSAEPHEDEPVVVSAVYRGGAPDAELALVNGQSWTYSQTQRTLGATKVATQGAAYFNLGFVDHTWSAAWTAKRISGPSLTKMVSTLRVQLYGAVAAPPYVGLITNWSRTDTRTGVQSTFFSRNGSAVGAAVYYNMSGNTVFYSPQGSLQIGN